VQKDARRFEPRRDHQRHLYPRDAEFLTRSGALPAERIRGVRDGGCPQRDREDASINLAAVAELTRLFPKIDIVLIESGGDNLARRFRPSSPI